MCIFSERHFGLVLRRTTSVLAPDFRVVAVNGIEERVVDIVPNIFHGYLEGYFPFILFVIVINCKIATLVNHVKPWESVLGISNG